MACNHSKFWIGLGIGSVLGALAYRLSRTQRVRKLESDIYDAIRGIGEDAEETLEDAERKALQMGAKAAETSAKIANKIAQEADKAAGIAKHS